MNNHIDSDTIKRFRQKNESFAFREEITGDRKVTVVEKDVLNENTQISVFEYESSVEGLTDLIINQQNYIAMLQQENTRLKQKSRKTT